VSGGYRLVLPEGWRRIRLSADPSAEADRLVDRAMARRNLGDGVDAVIARKSMREEVGAAFGRAADAGAVDIYLFEGRVEDVELPMSFIVSVLYLGPIAADIPLGELGIQLAGDAETTLVEVPVGPVVRWRRSRTESVAEQRARLAGSLSSTEPDVDGVSAEARRQLAVVRQFAEDHRDDLLTDTSIDYLIPIPTEPGAFVTISLDAPGPAYVEERVTHFDALIAGFGWTD
jgi:hypothetical protein